MGAGFVRRYGSDVGVEVIQQIEGVVIIDEPPPGSINGVGSGTVFHVGEFADMGLAVAVDGAANVTTKAQPTEVFGSSDYANKFGGFDSTIGDFGDSCGNGFAALSGKKFARLIIAAINLCSSKAVRVYRQLPTCKSATNSAPVVLMQAATVVAGREFRDGANRVNIGTRFSFTALGDYAHAIDGVVAIAGYGAQPTQIFSSATANFLTARGGDPVRKGDILVIGVIGGAGALGSNANTYRVFADATVDTWLTVEMMDGSDFDWTSGTGLPYRVHESTDADSGGAYAIDDAAGYTLPARPLDATVAAAAELNPAVIPPAGTATTWDPLSGLHMMTDPATGLVYDADIQAANAVSDAKIDALYQAALDSSLADKSPRCDINIVTTARESSTIRTLRKSHVLQASAVGFGRMTIQAPELTELVVDDILADADPGVGANRDERVLYTWPGEQIFVKEAVGYAIMGSDGLTHDDGILDLPADARLASVLSNLAPERNPGQATDPIPSVMSTVLGFQRGTPELTMSEYIQFKAKGICAMRFDRTGGGYIFQSGVTTSLTSGRLNINRRRMADFLEDSLAASLSQMSKLPLTTNLKDSIVLQVAAFMDALVSENNPPAQRINGYLLDDKSGNTPVLEAKGIWRLIVKARTLATLDELVLQVSVGEDVDVTAL
jgi:hypothetical protein